MTLYKLGDSVKFHLVYRDETRFGSAMTNRCDRTVRHLCPNILQHRQEHGLQETIARSRPLLEAAFDTGGLAELFERPGILRQEWLYPDANLVHPVAIDIERGIGDRFARIDLPPEMFADLASYWGEWQRGSEPPRDPIARQLWDALVGLGGFIPADGETAPVALGDATLVGHATVRVSDGTTTALFDPFLLPKAGAYPPGYQPLSVEELGTIDAVFITHAHPDHFDPGTLLRLGPDVPIFVPVIPRESVLAIDMEFRLHQLGFRRVRPLDWFEEVDLGQIRVVALPFYGEQPTVGEILHPEVRNRGNTYLVETQGRRLALTADSGTDRSGDIKQLAREASDRYGEIDTLFGGYRGFGLYPVQYLFSSVACYLPFVPRNAWRVRQRMMGDANDLLDVAEIWSALRVVPYADGGAPWYWQRGLGPCLDGSEIPLMAVDPTPESVRSIADRRSGSRQEGPIASPVSVCLLRPGDSLVFEGDRTSVQPVVWPYGDVSGDRSLD